jgi:hypothetical protein
MKIDSELQNALQNLRYYAQRVEELAREQHHYEFDNYVCYMGEDIVRLNCLALIGSSATRISFYCDEIDMNIAKLKERPLPSKAEIEQEQEVV